MPKTCTSYISARARFQMKPITLGNFLTDINERGDDVRTEEVLEGVGRKRRWWRTTARYAERRRQRYAMRNCGVGERRRPGGGVEADMRALSHVLRRGRDNAMQPAVRGNIRLFAHLLGLLGSLLG